MSSNHLPTRRGLAGQSLFISNASAAHSAKEHSISCAQNCDPFGPSGTAGIGRSGTERTDHRELKLVSNPQKCWATAFLNIANDNPNRIVANAGISARGSSALRVAPSPRASAREWCKYRKCLLEPSK